jgi:ketosteroid isomerase-like protein
MTANEAFVRDAVAAFNSGNLQAWLASVDPGARFYPVDFFPDFETLYEGHDGFASFWARWFEPWEQLRVDIVTIEDEGDFVTVDLHWTGTGAGAPPVEMPLGVAITVRDGLMTLMVAGRTGADARDKLLALASD